MSVSYSTYALKVAVVTSLAWGASSLYAQSSSSSSSSGGGNWKEETSCVVATPQGPAGAALMAQPWCKGIKGVGTDYDKKFKLPPGEGEKTLEKEIEDLHTMGEQCAGRAQHIIEKIKANSAPELNETKGQQAVHLAQGAIEYFQQSLDKDKDAVKAAGGFLDDLSGAISADLAACQKEKAKEDCIKVCTAWGDNNKKTISKCKAGMEEATPIIEKDLNGAKSILEALKTMLAHGDGKDENSNSGTGNTTTPQIIGGVGTGAGSGNSSDGSNNLVGSGGANAGSSGLGSGALDGSQFATDDGTVGGGRGLASGLSDGGWGSGGLFSDGDGAASSGGSGSGSGDSGLGGDSSGGKSKGATYSTAGTGALGAASAVPSYDFSGGAGKGGFDSAGKAKAEGDMSGPQNFMYVKKKRKATKAQRAELEAAAVKALNVENVTDGYSQAIAPAAAPKPASAPVPAAGGLQRK